MLRSRIAQGIAGATLSVLGLGGLAAISSPPAIAQEPTSADAEDMQQQMDAMIAQCTQMMQMMGDMDERGMSNMMGSGGMSNMMGGNR